MLQIVDYSEKAIAVIGTERDNKAMIADLKAMKGKWNKGLKCGAGWVFSKAKNGEQVTQYVAKWNAAHPASAQPSAPQSRPEHTPQAVEQPAQAPTIAQAPPIIIEDELEGAPF